MALNKVDITINSRMYTVISEESPEYMMKLGEHINEKIKLVLKGGKNIMGERPIVLAALNICDEYFSIAESKKGSDGKKNVELHESIQKLKEENANLKRELEDAQSGQVTMAETEAIANSAKVQGELEEAQTQIKFLEGQIRSLQEKIKQKEEDYKNREERLLKAFDVKKDEKA